MARPVAPLVSSLSNRPQGEKYALQPRGVASGRYLSTVLFLSCYPWHPDNIFNSTNSPTMEVSFDRTKFPLFSVFESILIFIPAALRPYNSPQYQTGAASTMTRTTPITKTHLLLLPPLPFRLRFALLALLVFRLVSEMFPLLSATIPRTCTIRYRSNSTKL
jgi:hypothetical protein